MTDTELLEWCYKNQNPNQPGTTTVIYEDFDANPEEIAQLLMDIYDQKKYFGKPFVSDTHAFVQFTDQGLEYCRENFG